MSWFSRAETTRLKRCVQSLLDHSHLGLFVSRGVNFQALGELFSLSAQEEGKQFQFRVSMLEVWSFRRRIYSPPRLMFSNKEPVTCFDVDMKSSRCSLSSTYSSITRTKGTYVGELRLHDLVYDPQPLTALVWEWLTIHLAKSNTCIFSKYL